MPMPLHKAPLGLLEIFRLRTLGRNPDEFGSQVIPVTDVTDNYGLDLLSGVAENAAAGVVSQFLTSVVSANARRYIAVSGNITIGAAAGTYLTMGIGYQLPNSPNFFYLNTTTITPVIGGVYRIAAGISPLLLPPGHAVFFSTNGNAAGADHLLELRYSFNVLDGR